MSSSVRRTMLAGAVAALAAAGPLAGCQKTTTQSPDGTTVTTTTTTIAPTESTASATPAVKSATNEAGSDAKEAMTKAGEVIEDSVITAKEKTALADPDVKGLAIDVDTSNGVVTLKGTADKAANLDCASRIARNTSG